MQKAYPTIKRYCHYGVLGLLLWLFALSAIAAPNQSLNLRVPTLATKLGWITEKNDYNICNGYYREEPIHYIPNPYASSQDQNYDIKADQVFYSMKGRSTFKGHVVVTQVGRELRADEARVFPDKVTGKPSKIDLYGHVRLIEPGKLLVGSEGHINLKTNVMTLENASYRMVLSEEKTITVANPKTGKKETHLYQMTARGTAKQIEQIKPHLYNLSSATYSTCSPDCHSWNLRSSKVRLNTDTGRGYSINTRLNIHNIPFAYTPYFNFPINDKRYSGFLMPSYGSKHRSGLIFRLPYYFNLAPNYDATFAPTLMTHRGVLLDLLFRYLTPNHSGDFKIGYLPSDREFKRFKKRAPVEWAGRPTLNALANASNNRKAFSWQNTTKFNDHWAADIDYNYVSDDYFIRDFGANLIDNSGDQLIRQTKLTYAGEHWDFLGNMQYYQTLHPVNESNVSNQYSRLPQLVLNSTYPDSLFGLDYSMQSEFVRFTERRNPYAAATDPDPVEGNRVSFRPGVSLPLNWPFAYFTPRVQLQVLQYDIHHAIQRNPSNPGMVLPMFDLKTGMYFDRHVNLFHHLYTQTLEPQVYYLYVPYRNQNRFPFFDTSTQAFNYDMMFQDNRFSGIDRIGDANQMTLALTTRFLDANTGDEKAKLSIGQIHYFRHRKVGLYSGYNGGYPLDTLDRRIVSPLAAAATYHFNPSWSANAGITWNSKYNDFDDETVGVQYKPDVYHIINVGYHYARGGDTLVGEPPNSPDNNLKQTDVSTYWKINNHWSVYGRWNYNWSHGHDQAYAYGLAYESCCWAVRFVAARTFVGPYPAPNTGNQYDREFYIQFSLKGLGNVGQGDPSSFLSSSIGGYTDSFGLEN